MINKARLLLIIEQAERGERLLRGDVQLLREAVDLLDDLATTVDKIMGGSSSLRDYRPETTQEIRRVDGWTGERIDNPTEWRG